MTTLDDHFVNSYAFGKLCEFVSTLFVGLDPARQKLSDNLHFIAVISPADFRQDKHQRLWAELQTKLLGKTKNIGLVREPIDRLTVHNKTLEFALTSIWSIYEECCTNIA